MTDAEMDNKNRTLAASALAIGYRNTAYWLGVFEQELEDDKREYLPDRPDLYEGFTFTTRNQIADLRRELAAYEREFHRRGLPLTACESSPQAA